MFDIFKKLFKLNKNKNSNTQLSSIKNIVNIRKKEELNLAETLMLEKYEKEYTDLLKNRVIFSKDLDIEKLKFNLKMEQELITNLIMQDEVNSFDIANQSIPNLNIVNMRVKISKINLYLSHILNLDTEIELKIIALEEIKHKIKFLSPLKLRALNAKIESLYLTKHTLCTSGNALYLEAQALIEGYKSQLKGKENFSHKKALEYKKDILYKMFNNVFKENNDKINELYLSEYDELAYIESKLETYVYNNIDKVDEMCKQLKEMNMVLSIDRKTNKKDILKKFNELELNFKIFSYFGRNIITDEMMYELYKLKFKIIVDFTLNNTPHTLLDKLNYIEIECYQAIILEKISKILDRENIIYNIVFYDNKRASASLISKIFKNGTDEYQWYKILTDKTLLTFLLSFEYSNRIYDFFLEYEDNKENYQINYFDDIFSWNTMLPLDTIFTIMDLNDGEKSDMCKLWKLAMKDRPKNELPKGLIKADFTKSGVRDNPLCNHLRQITFKSFKIFTPNSLKSTNGWYMNEARNIKYEFTEGIESIRNFYPARHMSELKLPSSVIDITCDAMNGLVFYKTRENYENIRTLILDNYKSIMENKVKLANILRYFLYIDIKKNTNSYRYVCLSTNLDSLVFRNYKDNKMDIVLTKKELKRIVCHIKNYHDEVIPWEELYYIIGCIDYLVDQKEQCQNNNIKYKKLK